MKRIVLFTLSLFLVGCTTLKQTRLYTFFHESSHKLPVEEQSYTTEAPHNQAYHFNFNSSSIQMKYLLSLRAQAYYLYNHPTARVQLSGYTDNIGSQKYNLGLGWRRAGSVANMLEHYGAKRHHLILESYGKKNPVAVGNSKQDRALNRRVILKYIDLPMKKR